MAVPGATTNYLTNGAGGAFVEAKEGGTILNNDNTGTVITKSLTLLDGVATAADSNTLPSVTASGIYNVQKALSGGTFAYSQAGKYVIARSSATLSGVAKTQLLTMGRGNSRKSIAQFYGSYGAKLLTAWRNNQWSWTHTLDSGAKITNMRINWLNAAGTAAASPDSLSSKNNAGAANASGMVNPVGGAVGYFIDSAANPTRAIPGELVMKVDFVTLSVGSGGDFFDYKPITGM